MKRLGDYLRKVREEKGLTLLQAYEITGVSPSHISSLENGARKGTPDILRKLADGYKLDYIDLAACAGYLSAEEAEEIKANKSLRDFLDQTARDMGLEEVKLEDIKKALKIVKAFEQGTL